MAGTTKDIVDIWIGRARKIVGFGTEVTVGGGLLSLSIHDMFAPASADLLTAVGIHPWGAALAGITFLGAGRPLVQALARHIGRGQ